MLIACPACMSFVDNAAHTWADQPRWLHCCRGISAHAVQMLSLQRSCDFHVTLRHQCTCCKACCFTQNLQETDAQMSSTQVFCCKLCVDQPALACLTTHLVQPRTSTMPTNMHKLLFFGATLLKNRVFALQLELEF